jgi:phosphoglycolate phosphatase-like HAD superfamily hydrolase
MNRVLLALDIDGTLIDTTPSFTRIIRELSGASVDEIARFRATGGFNDDWELTRAATAWIRAGRPEVIDRCNDLADVLSWCGNDPGDLSAQCTALYKDSYWQDEIPLVSSSLLESLGERFTVAACTGRDAWELDRAEQKLGFCFERATTSDVVKKPDPRALLRLRDDDHDVVILVGDTEADRRCALAARKQHGGVWYHHVASEIDVTTFLLELLESPDVADFAQRCCEPKDR